MDIDISAGELKNRRKKNWLIASIISILLVVLIWGFGVGLKPSIKRSAIRTAVAETGDIENTLSASGEVQPEFEQVIISPITATIQQVVLDAGSTVKAGDIILVLDKESTQLSYEKQTDQLELKRNGIAKLKLDLAKSFFDLKINDSIQAMEISSLRADLENAKRLEKAGGGTRESIETAEMKLRIAELKKKQLENDIQVKQQTMNMDIRESELSAQIQAKDLQEFQSKLKKSHIVATRQGVLTYVNKNLGSKVNEGEVLARLADLGSFRVIGTISDTYADQLKIGMSSIVKINETQLRGTLTNIEPSVQNNTLSFELALADAASALLRPRLKVEVYMVTAARSKVTRVANGPAFKGAGVQDIFVLTAEGNAERRTISTGLSNIDVIEIESGIQSGETVIISDLSTYKNIKQLKVKS
ncbi:MAG: HlyD family efflux transporter periplasmic adaptor subunit [Saprospiraceae bacterium]|nr:HlyD family efflux transporter periplasmic adaptor subunit [Saprospiraceae bacterium]